MSSDSGNNHNDSGENIFDNGNLHKKVFNSWNRHHAKFSFGVAKKWVNKGLPDNANEKDFLQWCTEHPFLKTKVTAVPSHLFPSSKFEQVNIIDVGPKPPYCKRRIMDDDVYDAFPFIRRYISRGLCFLEMKMPKQESNNVNGGNVQVFIITNAMKKFTGGPGDDDDVSSDLEKKQQEEEEKKKGDTHNDDSLNEVKKKWQHYFIEPVSNTHTVVQTSKENGEAAHFSIFKYLPHKNGSHTTTSEIPNSNNNNNTTSTNTDSMLMDMNNDDDDDEQNNDNLFYVIGSKSCHILIKKKEDIDYYDDKRFSYAREIAHDFMNILEKKKNLKDFQLFVDYMLYNHLTATFEYLNVKHMHIECFTFDHSELRFISFTSNKNWLDLCHSDLEKGRELAEKAGFLTITLNKFPYADIEKVFNLSRNMYSKEGSVIYYLNKSGKVIGLVKKKSVWYIIVRAIREKVRPFAERLLSKVSDKGQNKNDNQEQMNPDQMLKRIKQSLKNTLKQKQEWLQLDDKVTGQWENLAVQFVDWIYDALMVSKKESINATSLRSVFPLIWKQFLTETNKSDLINV